MKISKNEGDKRMNSVYKREFNWWQKVLQKTLGMWRINYDKRGVDSIDFNWGCFAPRFGLELMLHRGGYLNNDYAISFCLIWGKFCIKLPFKTRLHEGCDMPQYGFSTFDDSIIFYGGGKYNKSIGQMCGTNCCVWDLPWFSYTFEGHWIMAETGVWVMMDNFKLGDGEVITPWEFRKENALKEVHDYTYVRENGEVQHRKAECTVEFRRWHRKWFPWVKMEREVIDIKFDQEVGERTGSWKGGTTGCSYDMLGGESIEQCLRRMEKERTL